MICCLGPRQWAGLAALCVSLGACAISDVGEVDVRKGIVEVAETEARGAAEGLPKGSLEPKDQRTLDRLRPEPGGKCGPDQGGRNLAGLARPRARSALLKRNDIVSLRLRKVYISDGGYPPESVLTDLGFSAEALGETTRYFFDGFDHNLEIIVAARVFDYHADTPGGFRFGPEARDAARVLYYSDDVEQNQFLNFDNLPIYGPHPYSGAGMGLQIFIVEVDEASEEQKALLTSLASVGKAAATAAAPVISVLDRLANALLDNGNQDDRMFDYAIGFDTGFEGASVEYVSFEENLYALVVDHERDRNLPWHDLALNAETAELLICKGAGDDAKWEIFRESTYVILQVLKGYDGQPEANFEFDTYSELRGALIERRRSGVGAAQAIAELAPAIESNDRFREARHWLGRLRDGLAGGGQNQITRALHRLTALMVAHNPPATQSKKVVFTEQEMDYLLETLYEMVNNGTVPAGDQRLFTMGGIGTDAAKYATALAKYYKST